MDTREPDTRTRIQRAALALFAEQGYQRTSLRQIAERLRLTKAAILYHFPTKEHLVVDLIEPLLSSLEEVLEQAGGHRPEVARWILIEGWVDIVLRHRTSLGTLYHDISMFTHGPTFNRLMRIAMRGNEVVAGPNAGRRDQVRAVQTIAACTDPILFFTDVPDEVLRADMLDFPRRLWGVPDDLPARDVPDHPAVAAAPAPGPTAPGPEPAAPGPRPPAHPGVRAGHTGVRRRSGRPPAMSPEQVDTARRMYAAGTHSVAGIAATLGVSRATVYRHLEPNRDRF